ncbi:PAS domain-containing protein [Rhodovibrionaceae bacterium A322]
MRELYDYWNSKRQGRLAPRRSDIDPLDFHKLLPWIHIFKVLRPATGGPLDYKVILFGTELVQHLNQDLTGKLFSEIFTSPQSKALKASYDRTTMQAEVCFAELNAGWMGKEYIHYKRLLLPLSDDGIQVDRLLGCSFRVPYDPTDPD